MIPVLASTQPLTSDVSTISFTDKVKKFVSTISKSALELITKIFQSLNNLIANIADWCKRTFSSGPTTQETTVEEKNEKAEENVNKTTLLENTDEVQENIPEVSEIPEMTKVKVKKKSEKTEIKTKITESSDEIAETVLTKEILETKDAESTAKKDVNLPKNPVVKIEQSTEIVPVQKSPARLAVTKSLRVALPTLGLPAIGMWAIGASLPAIGFIGLGVTAVAVAGTALNALADYTSDKLLSVEEDKRIAEYMAAEETIQRLKNDFTKKQSKYDKIANPTEAQELQLIKDRREAKNLIQFEEIKKSELDKKLNAYEHYTSKLEESDTEIKNLEAQLQVANPKRASMINVPLKMLRANRKKIENKLNSAKLPSMNKTLSANLKNAFSTWNTSIAFESITSIPKNFSTSIANYSKISKPVTILTQVKPKAQANNSYLATLSSAVMNKKAAMGASVIGTIASVYLYGPSAIIETAIDLACANPLETVGLFSLSALTQTGRSGISAVWERTKGYFAKNPPVVQPIVIPVSVQQPAPQKQYDFIVIAGDNEPRVVDVTNEPAAVNSVVI